MHAIDWGAAFALFFIVEGLVPLVAPRFWRNRFERITVLRDGQIRTIGLVSVIAGAVIALALS